ncbi:MAG: serine/threonine protein kinase [Gemmataceae bacterium]|nr:serine/threonine protein kinase [Gemmataceae bacterium]
MKFTYRSGQEPLPGYTIKRGIGLGGFGEVYFAVTAGGKEVALKWIRSNLDIELRGVQQCLNLKHPNLVHLYDVRADAQGNHWLVMEYVAGEPLSAILARHPNGVAPELAAQWLQGLAQAIHCLHEHGIVHRDLKPANIFLENGIIKVGDYGLCKLMADSQHAGMTKDIGTVHYMAPEISTGNYNRQIDIYAAGVLLYEMLTGNVPFEGESAGEILMKHLTAAPDLSRVPKEFVAILEKALTKNPAHRYASIMELAKDVAIVMKQPGSIVMSLPVSNKLPPEIPSVIPVTPAMLFQDRLADLTGNLLWAIVASAGLAVMWSLVFGAGDYSKLVPIFFLTLASSWCVLIPTKLWPPIGRSDSWPRRLIHVTLGIGIGLFALWLEGYDLPMPWNAAARMDALQPWQAPFDPPTGMRVFGVLDRPSNTSMPILTCYIAYFGLMFLVLRWWKAAQLYRGTRFSIKAMFAVMFWAFLLLFLLPSLHHREIGFVSLTLAAVVCQITAPWKERVPIRKKKVRLATA